MKQLLITLFLLFGWQPTALAGLGSASHGMWSEVALGPGGADLPFRPTLTTDLALGGFSGRYDDLFLIGKRWQYGVRWRQDVLFQGGQVDRLHHAVLFDFERGIDLLVAGLRVGLQGGVLLAQDLRTPGLRTGGSVRATGAAVWTFARHMGLILRADVGVDILGKRPTPTLGLMIGFESAGEIRAPKRRH